jgi:hypothetical protein
MKNGGEASATYANRIEVNMVKIILMIERQENVVPILVLEEENTNEDVEPHAQINFFYNLSGEDGWGFLFIFFVAIPSLLLLLKPHLLSPCERVGWGIFFCESLIAMPQAFVGDFFT